MSIHRGEFFLKKFISQGDMRIANIFEVLSLIRKEKSITRKEIQNRMGLSWGGVSQIASRLIELSYVVEKKVQDTTSSGRTPSSLEINSGDNYIIGIDINLSGLYAVVVNLKNEVIYDEFLGCDAKNKDGFLNSIYLLLDSVTGRFSKNNIIALGVAMQGTVNSADGVSVSLNLDGWDDIPIGDMLFTRYGIPVYVAHDPDCILSSATSDNKEDALLIRVDNGIGMAVVKDESLVVGTGMHEIGNTFINSEGQICSLKQVLFGSERDADERVRVLALAIANSLVIFNTKKLFVCGSICEDVSFIEKLDEALKNYMGSEIRMQTYDAKQAAFGAAIFAIEKYLRYIK